MNDFRLIPSYYILNIITFCLFLYANILKDSIFVYVTFLLSRILSHLQSKTYCNVTLTVVEMNFELSLALVLLSTVVTRQITNITMDIPDVLVQGGFPRRSLLTNWTCCSF